MRRKYRNKKTEIDGYVFDSILESNRYLELKGMTCAKPKLISHLELQPKFKCDVNGKHICNYYADFRYWDEGSGAWIVEDVKGVRTTVYRLKRKLVEALYSIRIYEI